MKHKATDKIRLFVGLGNPDKQYIGNRHNIGFMAVDAIARAHDFSPFREKFRGLISEKTIGADKVFLFKPMTYMNNSGVPLSEMANFFKIPLAEIAVFHDELDLPAGKIRAKRGGGAAGHNGLRSIDQHMGQDYWRLRMGIGHPGEKHLVHSYVLQDFAKSDQEWLETMLDSCAHHWPICYEGQIDSYMSKIAMDMAPFFKDKEQQQEQKKDGE